MGLEESWEKFPWEKYPGGVEVSFGLVDRGSLLLIKPTRWSVTMPSCSLKQGQVLADAVALFVRQLDALGARISLEAGCAPQVCACHDDGRVFRVLVTVPCVQYGLSRTFERVDDPLLLDGYTSGDVMARYAAHVLGWRDAEKHLPLPASAAPRLQAA
jgi:hypothetical protein